MYAIYVILYFYIYVIMLWTDIIIELY